jgi:ABC-2 type transport system permease protein
MLNKKEEIRRNRKVFSAFVNKEFKHILRDRWTTIILLLMPVVMLLLFGYAINTEVKNSKIAVYDNSNDVATKTIINKLLVNEYFVLYKVLPSTGEIEQLFREGRIGMAIVFSENFNENLMHTGEAQVQLIVDGSDPNTAVILTGYATAIMTSAQQELLKINRIPLQITTEVKLLYNPTMKSVYNFVPGVMGMVLLLICAMMTSISIAREKEKGTMEVLLVSPVKPIYVLVSKSIPYFILSVVDLIIILVIAVFVMGVPIAGSFVSLITISFVYIFMSLSIGLLISLLVKSQDAALLISGMALMIPVILLSGLIFPIENMPWFLRAASQIVPTKWYIVAVKKLMIKGLGLTSILAELGVLCTMMTAFIFLCVKNYKNRLE